MIDITTSKVSLPATLFLVLSPGVLLRTSGTDVEVFGRTTDRAAVLFHALVFFLAFALVAKALGLVLTRTDLIVTTSLFVALSPGILLTLPPGSRAGGPVAAATHAVVFALIFAKLRKTFPKYY